MKKVTKMFRAYSIMDDVNGEESLIVHWFFDGIRKGVNYSETIKYYDKLPDIYKPTMEQYINEFFLEEEIALLKKCLWEKHKVHLFVEEVPTPINAIYFEDGFPECKRSFFKERDQCCGPFQELENSDLPFMVSGYFDTSRSVPINGLSSSMVYKGRLFLQEALKVLFPGDTSIDNKLLENAVKSAYQNGGHYVKEHGPQALQAYKKKLWEDLINK